jgi:uncharacterized membrane protein YvlD (DUF360 family)
MQHGYDLCLLSFAFWLMQLIIMPFIVLLSVSVNILKFGGHRIVVSALPLFAFAALGFGFGSFRPTQVEAIC